MNVKRELFMNYTWVVIRQNLDGLPPHVPRNDREVARSPSYVCCSVIICSSGVRVQTAIKDT